MFRLFTNTPECITRLLNNAIWNTTRTTVNLLAGLVTVLFLCCKKFDNFNEVHIQEYVLLPLYDLR